MREMIDLNSMSTCLGLFYAERLENYNSLYIHVYILRTFYFMRFFFFFFADIYDYIIFLTDLFDS